MSDQTEQHIEIDVPLESAKEWIELEKLLGGLTREHKPSRLHLINEIFKAAVKLARENPGTLNLKITASVLKELRYSFKLFYPFRHTPKITMFGSARTSPKDPSYAFAKEFAHEAVSRNYMIITGGGPGIMAAGNEAAKDKGFGLNIKLPFEQSANPFIDPKNMLVNYKYFFTRKLFLVKQASAFAFFPGGFGTFDEAFEVLTLLQTGKSNLIPVVFLEPPGFGFWKAFQKFLYDEVMKRGFISPQDKSLFHFFDDAKAAMDHIHHFYKIYHSMRFVRDDISIRLNKELSEAAFKKVCDKFKYLSRTGVFTRGGPLEDEQNEPELQSLPRLIFPCDRKDFAGLRQLVDFINDNAV